MNIQERIAHLEAEKKKLQQRNDWYNLYTDAYDARMRLIEAIDIELAGLYQKVS